MKFLFVLILVGVVAVVIPETSSATLESRLDNGLSVRKKEHDHSHESSEEDDHRKPGPGPKHGGPKHKPHGPKHDGPKPKPHGPKHDGPKHKPHGPKHDGPKPKPHEHKPKHHGPKHEPKGPKPHSHEVETNIVLLEQVIIEFRNTIEVYVRDYARANSIEINVVFDQFCANLDIFVSNFKQIIIRAQTDSRVDINIVLRELRILIVEFQTNTITIFSRTCGSNASVIIQIEECFVSFNKFLVEYVETELSVEWEYIEVQQIKEEKSNESRSDESRSDESRSDESRSDESRSDESRSDESRSEESRESKNSYVSTSVLLQQVIVEFRNTVEVYVRDYARANRIDINIAFDQFSAALDTFVYNFRQIILRESRVEINIVLQEVRTLIIEFQTNTINIFSRACGSNASVLAQIEECFVSFNKFLVEYVQTELSTGDWTDKEAQEYEETTEASYAGIFDLFDEVIVEFRETIQIYLRDYAKADRIQVDNEFAYFCSSLKTFQYNFKQIIIRACETRAEIFDVVREVQILIKQFQTSTNSIFLRTGGNNSRLISQINECFISFNDFVERYIVTVMSETSTSISTSTTTTVNQQEEGLYYFLILVDKIFTEVNTRIFSCVQSSSQSTTIDVEKILLQIQDACVSFQIKFRQIMAQAVQSRTSIKIVIKNLESLIAEYQNNISKIVYRLNINVASLNKQIQSIISTLSATVKQFITLLAGESQNNEACIELSGGIDEVLAVLKSLLNTGNSLLNSIFGGSQSTTWSTTSTNNKDTKKNDFSRLDATISPFRDNEPKAQKVYGDNTYGQKREASTSPPIDTWSSNNAYEVKSNVRPTIVVNKQAEGLEGLLGDVGGLVAGLGGESNDVYSTTYESNSNRRPTIIVNKEIGGLPSVLGGAGKLVGSLVGEPTNKWSTNNVYGGNTNGRTIVVNKQPGSVAGLLGGVGELLG